MDRQVRWYRSIPFDGEDIFDWTLLVVNKPREIKQILDRARLEFAMVLDEVKIESGLTVKSQGLHYDLRRLQSEVYNPDWRNIYRGRVLHDRQLNPKTCSDNWKSLIEKVASGKL